MAANGFKEVAMNADEKFFLGRQPILDRTQQIVGFELLFRSAESLLAPRTFTTPGGQRQRHRERALRLRLSGRARPAQGLFQRHPRTC